MGAFSGLTKFWGINLSEIARMLDYREENILILENKELSLQTRYPIVYSNLRSCVHNCNRRSPMEYGQDLVASWLFEDSLVYGFSRRGEILELSEEDRNRQILSSTMVSSSSDCIYGYGGKQLRIEIMNDYIGFWERNGLLHLRDKKFCKLKKEKAILLAVSIRSRDYYLIDFKSDISYTFISSHHPYGGKPAYEIPLNGFTAKQSTTTNIINDLHKILA